MKKLLLSLFLLVFTATSVCADTIPVEQLKGLARNPKADRIQDGEHDQFQNVYINYGNIENVKGRDRLNSTAHADIVVNGSWYYENQAGTTKKLIVAESTSLVSYDIDGTNRVVLASSLTNEKRDAVQIGDTLYITSTTDGIYKYLGGVTAIALGTAIGPPGILSGITATIGGGMTPGVDMQVAANLGFDSTCGQPSSVQIASGCLCTNGGGTDCGLADYGGDNVASDTGTSETAATNATYRYKVTYFSSIYGIESEPSAENTVNLSGDNRFTWTATNCTECDTSCDSSAFPGNGCANATPLAQCCTSIEYVTANKQTATAATLPGGITGPYNTLRIYRTVAGGSDFFLNGEQSSGTYRDGRPDNSLSTPLDTTIDTIAPPSYRYIEEYKGVIFVAEGTNINFNKIPVSNTVANADTYWLASDALQVTGNITGLKKASDSLLIFTTTSIYQVVGYGAESFRLIPLITGIGAINDETIETDINGDVMFFSGTSGLYKLSIGQQQTDKLSGSIVESNNAKLTKLSSPNMDKVFTGEDETIVLAPSTYTASHAYYDTDNELYHLYIGTHDILFDPANKAWSSIPATQMLSSVWRKSPNAVGVGVLIDNLGFFFNNWLGYENGIESGSVTGPITSSTNNTVVCSTCNFNTTGDGLKGLWVYLDNENGEYRQISSNTGTTLTVTSNWTTNPISSDNIYVAYIISKWRTKQYSLVKYPQESSVTKFYINHNKSDSEQEVVVMSFQEKSENAVNIFSEHGTIDFSLYHSNVFNTRMRSTWVQWGFKTFIYNTSATANPPIDIVSYAIEAEASTKLAGSH